MTTPIAYGDQAGIPLAYGELFSPYGRRSLWSMIVRCCPACSHMHNHKISNPTARSWVKTGSCGSAYKVLVAVDERRAA